MFHQVEKMGIQDYIALGKIQMPDLRDSYKTALVPVGIALNFVGSTLTRTFQIPLFLDQGGIMLVSMTCGPFWGVITAILNTVVNVLTRGPLSWFFIFTPITTALIWGFGTKYGMTRRWPTYIILCITLALGLSFVTAPIVVYVYGGLGGTGVDLIFTAMWTAWGDMLGARFWSEFISSMIDKGILSILVLSILRAMPSKEFQRVTPWFKEQQ